MARLRATVSTQGPSAPRSGSNACIRFHTRRNVSCTRSSAAAEFRTMRSISEYTSRP